MQLRSGDSHGGELTPAVLVEGALDPLPAGRAAAPSDLRRPSAARTGSGPRGLARRAAVTASWDALVAVSALNVGVGSEGGFVVGSVRFAPQSIFMVIGIALTTLLVLAAAGMYRDRTLRLGPGLQLAGQLGLCGVVVSWLALTSSRLLDLPAEDTHVLFLAVVLPAGWLLVRWALHLRFVAAPERIILVGSGLIAGRVSEVSGRGRSRARMIVGRVGTGPAREEGPPLLGGVHELPRILAEDRIDRVIVAFAGERDSQMVDVLRDCTAGGVPVDVVPRFFELVGPSPRSTTLGALSLMEIPARGLTPAQRAAKRGLDIVVSALLLIVLSPVLAAAAAATALVDGRPVFFRQLREGHRGSTFSMLKFRTMRPGSEPTALDAPSHGSAGCAIDGHKRAASARVTRIGGVLRRSSIDELPQLWNVLKGDMSLVGPRPIPLYESQFLTTWHHCRHDVKPGLTGLWQVSGRSDIDWSERMQLDYTYVSHWSFGSDLGILMRTLPAVLRKEGAV